MTAVLVIVQGVVLFATAWTFSYAQAWIYLGLQLVSMTATNAYLLKHDPVLLERRLTIEESGESDRLQRRVIALMKVMMLALLVIAGLDHRLSWSRVHPVVVVAGAILFAAGAALVFAVFRANTFTSSVIELMPQQTVVATGPYRLVRHPMYFGALLTGLAAPLVLGSYMAELLVPPTFVLLVVRIFGEERFLSARLRGYGQYVQATPRRLIPGVW